MPSSINVSGVTMYKPGVYGFVDASNAGSVSASFGNMAVVGPLPTLKTDTPVRVNSAQALRALDPANLDFARIAKLAFNPGNDAQVSGAGSVTLVNAQTVAQAKRTLLDANGVATIELAAKTWGFRGNQIWTSVGFNTDTNGRDVKLTQPGFAAEEYKNLQSGKLVELLCASVDLAGADDTVLATVNATQWKAEWTKRLSLAVNPATSITQTFTQLLIAGKLYVKVVKAAPVATVRFTVTGKDHTGAAKTNITFDVLVAAQSADPAWLEFTSGGTSAVPGAVLLWSEITSIANNAVNTEVLDAKGIAYDLPCASFAKVSDVCTQINNFSSKNFTAAILSPKAYQIPSTEIDVQTAVSIKTADTDMFLRADVWAIVQGLAASKIITATRLGTAVLRPATSGGMLAGGNETTLTDPSVRYPLALAAIADKDVQVVAMLDADIEAGKALKVHCTNAAVSFGRERNGWYGAAPGLAVDTATTGLAALVNTLNSRNVSLVADKAQVAATIAGGSSEWLDPKYVAVACAGAQCGTPVATPLTEKAFDFLDISHSWLDGSDENYVISNNICAFYKNSFGRPTCLRSVTTSNDNNFYSEMSANESINTSIRVLRLALKAQIGQPITSAMPPSVIQGLAVLSLDQQVLQGFIKAYRNVVVVLDGDTYSVDYEVAPVQPLNFIAVTAHLGQF